MAQQAADVRRRPVALPVPVQHQRPPPRAPEHHGGAQSRHAPADDYAVEVVIHAGTVASRPSHPGLWRTALAAHSCRVSESVEIPGRFNGPRQSGNGGYSAGAIAAFLDGAAEVTLRKPVPLDSPLEVVRDGDEAVRVLDDEALIAEARATPDFELEVPDPVSPAEARAATNRYRGTTDGEFSRCFVCGRARDGAFGVFAGAVEGRDVVASPWTPVPWTADEAGDVLPEFVWAVLDCPTYFALYPDELPMSVLAQLTARIDAPVVAGEEHVVMAWPIEKDGRKHQAGSAVLSADGEVLAVARGLLIQLQAE
jgi:hypothetical protein